MTISTLPQYRRLGLALTAGLLMSAVIPGVATAAATVSCGTTLKVSTKLSTDLTCPAGNGLTLYRGVTLNLGGHRLVGPGTGTAVTLSAKGGSVVTNGTISRWGLGLLQDSIDATETVLPSTVSRVTITRAPVQFSWFSRVSVTSSTFTDSPLSIDETTFTATSSTFTRSDIDGWASDITVTDATIVGGGVGSSYNRQTTVASSTMDGTGYAGSPGSCSETGLTIKDTSVRNYRAPIVGWYCAVWLTNSVFTNNPGGVSTDTSYTPETYVSAWITGNTFLNNGVALHVGPAVITGNTFSGNVTGLIPNMPATTTVSGNTFSKNSSSGIKAAGNGLILKNNKAVDNGRWGIYAPAAVNKGGNVAYGNAAGQCFGLSCTGR